MPRVQLRRSKAGPAWAGHPWIFAGSIARGDQVEPGAWVEVCDSDGKTIGWGLNSPRSQLRVRLVTWGAEAPSAAHLAIDAEQPFWADKLRGCLARRGLVEGDRPPEARRLVNAEGDGIPGLTVDLLGSVAVVQISTLPMGQRRDVIMGAVREVVRPDALLMADSERAAELEGFEAHRGWWGARIESPITFRDGGLDYHLDPEVLQKTGHYLDVREHRSWFSARATGKRVFDGFCFSGGFSLASAAAGAAHCVGVDSSASAIALATHNAEAMGLAPRIDFVRGDVFDRLRSSADRGEVFDMVTLDPPKYAPRARDRHQAAKAYGALALEALRVLAPGGIFGLSSCSHHFGEADLLRAIASAARRRGRTLDVVHVGGHDGDHPYPAGMAEGRYLTFVFCQARRG